MNKQATEKPKQPATDSEDQSGTKNERRPVRPTGVAEFDYMLKGGLPTDSTILLSGASGTGKTILAMQWLFAGFDQFKEPGVYISLTEPVAKSMKNVAEMTFFNKDVVNPMQVYFTDLRGMMKGMDLEYKELEGEDIRKILDAIRNLVKESGAKRVVLDSITAMAYRLKDENSLRQFIFELGTMLGQLDANVIMTSEVVGKGFSVFGVEEFIADGIIRLDHKLTNNEDERQLTVVKMRGTDYDAHAALMRITSDGLNLYPRLSRELTYEVSNQRASTGVPGLDKMTSGGYFVGSSVLLTGASGTGKTLVALQFLMAGVEAGEKCIYVSFEESRDQLIRNAQAFGWSLEEYEKKGLLKVLVAYPEQRYLEEHIEAVTSGVQEFGAKRVVVDSLSSLSNVFSERHLHDYTGRLTSFLKTQGVTSLLTYASSNLLGAATISEASLSSITDHIIMLRYVEIKSELHHALLILKMRGSKHDKKLRELSFTATGVQVAADFSGYEGVMSGSTRKIASSTEEQLHSLFVEALGPMGEQMFAQERDKGLTPESVRKLMGELGNQGIISKQRKEEFVTRSEAIFGVGTADSDADASGETNESSNS